MFELKNKYIGRRKLIVKNWLIKIGKRLKRILRSNWISNIKTWFTCKIFGRRKDFKKTSRIWYPIKTKINLRIEQKLISIRRIIKYKKWRNIWTINYNWQAKREYRGTN